LGQALVVVDEAHLLSAAMLEEVRFLTNFAMDSASPMTVILVGQPKLRHRLALKSFDAIRSDCSSATTSPLFPPRTAPPTSATT
jgi:type II secretory pathway predicted ATPase ExeA